MKKMKKTVLLGIMLLLLLQLCGCEYFFTGTEDVYVDPNLYVDITQEVVEDYDHREEDFERVEDQYGAEITITQEYTFRKPEYLEEHYQKHGIEMGFASAEDYLEAANKVVNNPDALHRIEQEDGDDVYYVVATSEFVVVSTDGYIRTYYYADYDYFMRQ
ncbi:MAG: hypothetical protein IJ291_03605 [Lachnospiraceae bacterium]|nr:hypothetical protein [Lachnospiraceae bacterium]